MPVHLGSMDRSVETIIRHNKGKIHPGDVFALNAPYNGGTHLPDITVCTPVFDDRRKRKILFWVASRGHHADVGGIAPGSMSPLATTIDEEGVCIDNFKLVDRGRFREKELMHAAHRARHIRRAIRSRTSTTSRRRSPPTRRACGAAQDGRAFRLPVVKAYMGHVQDNAAESVRRVLDRLHDIRVRIPDGPGHGRSR